MCPYNLCLIERLGMLEKLLQNLLARWKSLWSFSPNTKDLKIVGSCKQTGNCCRNLILVYRGKPIRAIAQFKKAAKQMDYYQLFTPHETQAEDGMLRFTCSKLSADNRCTIYASRPQICRQYPQVKIVTLGGGLLPGCGYQIVSQKSFAEHLNEKERR